MEGYKWLFIIFLLLGSLILFSNQAFSYDNFSTHPALTEEIVKFYNLNFPEEISEQEKEWLKYGSIHEDDPPRYINHFYDPTTGQGWTGERMDKIPAPIVRQFVLIGLSTC
jgi:hypothetical protein